MSSLFGIFSQKIRSTMQRIIARDVRQGVLNTTQGENVQLVDSVLVEINKSYSSMSAVIADVDNYRNYYLVELLLQMYVEEALSADPSTDELFRISVEDDAKNCKQIKEQIDYLSDTFDIESIIRDNIYDMLFYNEYSFKLVFDENKKKGIVDIIDGFAPGRLIAIYRKNVPIKFFELDAYEIHEYQPYEFWHFQLMPEKIRIVNNKERKYIKMNPYTLRYGKPFLASVLPQLKELITLEATSIARSLSDLMRKSMINVSAPESLDPQQLKELSMYYENLINSNSITSADFSIISDIGSTLSELSKIKVIPSDSQRGQISSIDLRNSQDDDTFDKIKDKREIITSSFAIPYDLLFSSEGSSLNLRSFTSFQKRVKNIQIRCANSIKQLIAIQCAAVGVQIEKLEDINVNFLNSINVAELDRLEFQDTKMQSIMEFYNNVSGIAEDEEVGEYVDKKELLRYLKDNFRSIKGAENIIKDI